MTPYHDEWEEYGCKGVFHPHEKRIEQNKPWNKKKAQGQEAELDV